MKFKKYIHEKADAEILETVFVTIESVLDQIHFQLQRGSASNVRQNILSLLRDTGGWSDSVRISARHGLTLTAKKGQTALCLQTGNMARFYADLLKLQAQFLDGKINSAIYILPTQTAAKIMGDNMAHFERLTKELKYTFHKVITIPTIVYGFISD